MPPVVVCSVFPGSHHLFLLIENFGLLGTVYEMKINGILYPFRIDSLMSSIVGIFLYLKQMYSEIRAIPYD